MLDTCQAIWAYIGGWLTPAILFLLLNVVIGTIFLSSSSHTRHRPRHDGDPSASSGDHFPFPLLRTSSPVLERLRSLTLHRFRSGDLPLDPPPSATVHHEYPSSSSAVSSAMNDVYTPPSAAESTGAPPDHIPLSRTSSVLQRLRSISLYRFRSGDLPLDTLPAEEAPEPVPSKEKTDGTGAGEEQDFGRSQSESSRPAKASSKGRSTGKMKKSASSCEAASEIVRKTPAAAAAAAIDEAGEVNARADDFINKFREQLKIQRLNSLLNYKEMLKRGI